ncbi:uncharacterized protein P884DRAFT_271024 [Thermothelomyces heterothallicus CBS 202.75]|uniref:uncharacterized protein n=1 Tax=Thermothelomyces heterothallicus CBS 202.75 TaxID=1149848 RepID=UPI003742D813
MVISETGHKETPAPRSFAEPWFLGHSGLGTLLPDPLSSRLHSISLSRSGVHRKLARNRPWKEWKREEKEERRKEKLRADPRFSSFQDASREGELPAAKCCVGGGAAGSAQNRAAAALPVSICKLSEIEKAESVCRQRGGTTVDRLHVDEEAGGRADCSCLSPPDRLRTHGIFPVAWSSVEFCSSSLTLSVEISQHPSISLNLELPKYRMAFYILSLKDVV